MISTFFINRPIVAMVIAIVTVILGVLALRGLPLAQFPQIVPPQINVSTTYTGADAVTIEQSVSSPIEQQVSGVKGMLYMLSTNANAGTENLSVTFDISTDPDIDQVNVQNRVSQALSSLPTDVSQFGVTIRQSTGSPMLLISLYSPNKSYDSLFLANYNNINVVDTLFRVPGVGDVTVFGSTQYAMRIWVNPDVLAKLGISVTDIANAVRQQSTVNPSGQVGAEPAPTGKEMTYTVRSQGRLQTPEEFAQIVVLEKPDGSIVRLKDVARIELGGQSYAQRSRLGGEPSSTIGVYQAPGSNALAVVNGVKAAMAQLKTRFPDDLDYAVTLDTTQAVTEGIREIVITLIIAVVLVILVVYLFLPIGLMGGIQGSLNKQFAFTIAISVLLSAFNALTLSPALAALLLRPRKESKGLLARFFGAFNRLFDKATHGYVNVSHALIRKSAIAVLILAGFAVAAGVLGYRLPTSFLPAEDYGYMYVNVQLPPASSMERTDQALQKVEAILAKTAGVQYYTTISGFSNLSRVSASYQGFFFIALKPWAERTTPQVQAQGIVDTLNKQMAAEVPEANCIALTPPAIPGLGNAGGFSLYIQDRSGGTVQFLDQNLQKFLDAARKRPELTGVTSQFNSSVPQIYADVDRDKVLKQGVAISDVYQTLQAYLGGLYVNQFNRFGRQWRVFLQG